MTTKEKVVGEALKRVERRLSSIVEAIERDPHGELASLYGEASRMLKERPSVEERTDPDFVESITQMATRERQLKREIRKRSADFIFKLIDDRVRLEMERDDLRNELFYIKMGR